MTLAVKTLLITGALALAACNTKQPEQTANTADSTHVAPTPMGQMAGGMSMDSMSGGDMSHQMSMMNDRMVQHLGKADSGYDIRFIDMMIPHHEGAVMMAKDALTKAQHPELRKRAQEIIQAQQREIDEMRQWRKEWAK